MAAGHTIRKYGILSDDGDCLYTFDTLADLMEAVDDRDDGLEASESIIRIDEYTVLAVGQ